MSETGSTPLPESLDRAAIEAVIPHRDPFLLVDVIGGVEREQIVGRWTPRADAFWFAGHYPGEPVTPGVIITEHALQIGAILVSLRLGGFAETDGIPVLAKITSARFRRIVRPGEELVTRVRVDEVVSSAWIMTAGVRTSGERVADLEFVLTATTAAGRRADS